MAPIWNGIGFAIGLVVGLAAIFFVGHWLRFRWYLTRWADSSKMPFDVRQKILRTAVARFRKERPIMSPEERQKAAVQMLSVFGTDTPMDSETQNELVSEAMQMLSASEPKEDKKPLPKGMYLDEILPEEWTEKDLEKLERAGKERIKNKDS